MQREHNYTTMRVGGRPLPSLLFVVCELCLRLRSDSRSCLRFLVCCFFPCCYIFLFGFDIDREGVGVLVPIVYNR